MKSYLDQGYIDVDESYSKYRYIYPHHFHIYNGGRITYNKNYIHLYKK